MSEAIITSYYPSILRRPGSPEEIASWVTVFNGGLLSLAQIRESFIASSEANNFVDPVIRLYQSAFNRQPDPDGLDFWASELRAGKTVDQIAVSFTGSQEFVNLYGAGTAVTAAFLSALYANVLGRAASGAEIDAWLSLGLSRAAVLNGFSESTEARMRFNDPINTLLDSIATGSAALDPSSQLGGVSGLPIVGETFTLTTGADNIVGTANSDVINGVVGTGGTLSAADIINGGGGTDTLNITAVAGAGDVLAGALISNVEIIGVRSTVDQALTLNASGLGLTGVNLTGSNTNTTMLSNLASGATVTVGAGANLTGAITAGYVAGATTASLAYAGGTSGAVNVTGAGVTTANIASNGAANTAGIINVAGAATINIAAATNLTATSIETTRANSTLNVSGAATSVDVGTLNTNLRTINASGMTAGGLTVTLSNAAQVVKGGAGSDVITTRGTGEILTGSVDAGAGIDRLVVRASTDLNSAAKGARYTNFEVLQVENGVIDVNLDHIAGITAIRINDGDLATGVTNLTAQQAGAITIVGADGAAGAITIGVKGAATPLQIDTVSLTINDGLAATNTLNLGTPEITNVERLTINAVDNYTIDSLEDAASLDTITLSGAGTQGITFGAVNIASNFAVNGSAATGALTIDASGATGDNAISITGGSAADNLTGTANGDVINGGAGADTITGGGGADILTGGAGNDTFVFGSRADTRKAVYSNFEDIDHITDFVGNGSAAGDSIRLGIGANAFGDGFAFTGSTVANVTAVTVASANDFVALATAVQAASAGVASNDITARIYDVTVSGGALAGRVLIVNDDVAAITADDTFINLTGITGALNAQDFLFG